MQGVAVQAVLNTLQLIVFEKIDFWIMGSQKSEEKS